MYLYDTIGEEDVNLSEKFIDEGLAVFVSTDIEQEKAAALVNMPAYSSETVSMPSCCNCFNFVLYNLFLERKVSILCFLNIPIRRPMEAAMYPRMSRLLTTFTLGRTLYMSLLPLDPMWGLLLMPLRCNRSVTRAIFFY